MPTIQMNVFKNVFQLYFVVSIFISHFDNRNYHWKWIAIQEKIDDINMILLSQFTMTKIIEQCNNWWNWTLVYTINFNADYFCKHKCNYCVFHKTGKTNCTKFVRCFVFLPFLFIHIIIMLISDCNHLELCQRIHPNESLTICNCIDIRIRSSILLWIATCWQ